MSIKTISYSVLLLALIAGGTSKDDARFSGEAEQYFIFIGEKIDVNEVPSKNGKLQFDYEFVARYKVIENVLGNIATEEIEFSVYDHYGIPAFSKYKNVLLYVILDEGKYYHSKYQYFSLCETKDGKWASTYAVNDYNHEYNIDTQITPEKIDFENPVLIDISQHDEKTIQKWFPEPYFDIKANIAIGVYGNYIEDLILLKKNGVLKARGDFQ